ncbi:MAG TPA: cytochrome P450 [Solirubrobacterales bacterium]|nr:cytochrome P450 [Solirubrobacterales bacterium]
MAILPPGSRTPGAVNAVQFTRDPVGFLERQWHRYGDAFSINFPGFGRMAYFAAPDTVKEIFTGDPGALHAGEANARVLEPALGKFSLLTLDEGDHMRQRKLLLPPFHGERVRRYRELITGIAEREIDRWPTGSPMPLRPRMQAITLEVILRAVFGVRGEDRLARFRATLPQLTEASGVVMWLPFMRHNFGPWSPWARFQRMRRAVDALVYEEIRLRRADPDMEERDDVLSLLLQARHEDGSPMTDEELRDELITLLTAGHETSATALAWTFERLLRTPHALARLLGDLDDEPYLDAVVKETLRVRPVVIDVARVAKRDVEIGGWAIPAETIVVPAIALVQLRPDLYPEPQEFRPERFLGEDQPPAYSWIPFGGGVRRCIGAAFAQVEVKTVLRAVLEKVRLTAPDPAPERQRSRHVTLVPSRDAMVVVERRLASPDNRDAPLLSTRA